MVAKQRACKCEGGHVDVGLLKIILRWVPVLANEDPFFNKRSPPTTEVAARSAERLYRVSLLHGYNGQSVDIVPSQRLS